MSELLQAESTDPAPAMPRDIEPALSHTLDTSRIGGAICHVGEYSGRFHDHIFYIALGNLCAQHRFQHWAARVISTAQAKNLQANLLWYASVEKIVEPDPCNAEPAAFIRALAY